MSYSCSLNVVECDARMNVLDVRKARKLLDKADVYLESCFLDEMRKASDAAIDEGVTSGTIEIPAARCWLSGNYLSADTMAIIAHLISGTLSGYFVGDDGGIHGGFVIKDGVLSKHAVTITLAEP